MSRKQFIVPRGGKVTVGLPVASATDAAKQAAEAAQPTQPGGVMPTEELDDLYVFRGGGVKFFDLGTKLGGSDGYTEDFHTMIFGVGSFTTFFNSILTDLLDDWKGEVDGMPKRRRIPFVAQDVYIDVNQQNPPHLDKTAILGEDESRPFLDDLFHFPEITTPASNEGWKKKGNWKTLGDGAAGELKWNKKTDQFRVDAWGFYKDFVMPAGGFSDAGIKITSEPSSDAEEVNIDDFDFANIKEIYLSPFPLIMQINVQDLPFPDGTTGFAGNALLSRMSPTTGIHFDVIGTVTRPYTVNPDVRSTVDQLAVTIGLYDYVVSGTPFRADAHIYLNTLGSGFGTVTPFLRAIVVNKAGDFYIWSVNATFYTKYSAYLASHGFSHGSINGDGT